MKPLISLDVFDTAIFRKVFYPTDIFNVVEDVVGNNFKKLRVEAQSKAGKKNASYTFLDIYKEMSYPFNPKEEIKAELINCKANPYILEKYNSGDADYIFISDMYLPSTIIKSMLEKCGYKNPQVFVSCEFKAGKGSGKLFSEVEKVLNRKISKHYGDNYNADIQGAKKAGIPEVEYVGPPIYNKKVVTPNLRNVRLRKFLIDNELSNKPIAEKIGCQFAPLVLAFTQGVLNSASDKQTIFFNARDGFLMYVVARWILKTKKKIKYCRVSRKSCLLADFITQHAITHSCNSASFNYFKIQRVATIKELFEAFGIKEVLIPNTLKKYGVGLDTNIEMNPRKMQILGEASVEAQTSIYKKAAETRRNFLKYIEYLGMKNGDIFVDLGYAGTIQGIIKRITGIDLKGKYINTYTKGNGNYMGVRFSRSAFFPEDLVGYHGAVLEAVFSESKGTVIGYEDSGKPILLKDTKYRKDLTRTILKGLFKGVKDLIKEEIEVGVEDCCTILRRYISIPTIEEATFGNSITFENGSVDNESVVWFNKDWIRRGKIRECYNRSYWKEAFKILLENDKELSFLMREIK